MKKSKSSLLLKLLYCYLPFFFLPVVLLVGISFYFWFAPSDALLPILHWHSKIIFESNTSIAFYIIGTVKQKFNPDLRGRFWEPLLTKTRFNYTIHYLGDVEFTVNGTTFIDIRNNSSNIDDRQLCERVSASWNHFLKYHPNTKWYFKGTHDTYINVPELLKLISELEKKGDPMEAYNFAYNVHRYYRTVYPQGGAGFLASNYAIRRFNQRPSLFRRKCRATADDVGLVGVFKAHNLSIMKYATTKFIVTWPYMQAKMIRNNVTYNLPQCPPYFLYRKDGFRLYTCPAYKPAVVHFHHLPMEYAKQSIETAKKNWGVYFKTEFKPIFCLLNQSQI